MGKRKSDSSDRLRIRAARPVAERETLIPCPACDGSAVHRYDDGWRYRVRVCRWCDGVGATNGEVYKMFRRWRRIRAWNIARGTCVR